MLRTTHPASKVTKLGPKWEGPFKVIGKLSFRAYYLEDAYGKAIQGPRTTSIYTYIVVSL